MLANEPGREKASIQTYSNPICECIRMVAHRAASMTGFNDPAANGATVRGMRVAAIKLEGTCKHMCERMT